jgi:hypothetical protein
MRPRVSELFSNVVLHEGTNTQFKNQIIAREKTMIYSLCGIEKSGAPALARTMLLVISSTLIVSFVQAQSVAKQKFDFDSHKLLQLPDEFENVVTGSGPEGEWRTVADPTAPSPPNALCHIPILATVLNYPVVVVSAGSYKDVLVKVKVKMVAGKIDFGGGLVARYNDPKNYYVCRINAIEDIRMFKMIKGKRTTIGSTLLEIPAQIWHQLEFEIRGNRLRGYLNGMLVIETTEDTLKEGKVGFWLKCDSQTNFDDFEIIPLN